MKRNKIRKKWKKENKKFFKRRMEKIKNEGEREKERKRRREKLKDQVRRSAILGGGAEKKTLQGNEYENCWAFLLDF